jgi:hypothetical protein
VAMLVTADDVSLLHSHPIWVKKVTTKLKILLK